MHVLPKQCSMPCAPFNPVDYMTAEEERRLRAVETIRDL